MSNKNSNYPNAKQPQATPEEIGELVGVIDKLRQFPPVRKNEPEEIRKRLDYFFEYCTDYDVKPSVEGMALCLGVTRQCLWAWESDQNSEAGRLVWRAKAVINTLLTTWTLDGKISPVTTIWLQKNNFGYSDAKTLEIKPPQMGRPAISLEEQLKESGLVWDVEREEYVPVIETEGRIEDGRETGKESN